MPDTADTDRNFKYLIFLLTHFFGIVHSPTPAMIYCRSFSMEVQRKWL
jgi:hypothetical protein